MPSNSTKWKISIFSLIIFIIIVNPNTYKFTDKLLGGIIGPLCDYNGCPTDRGLLVHSLVYLLIVRYSMDLNMF